MSLRRFDGSNFNFWKEQMQDYLIVKGQIDPIENENAPVVEAGQNRPRHDLDALVGVGVLHSAIMHYSFQTLEEAVGNLWKEGRLN